MTGITSADINEISKGAAEINISSEKSTKEIQAVEQKITPWEVEGAVVNGQQVAVDYTNLVKKFGTQLIDDQLLERFERVTGVKPHIFLRRGIFFSHRDMGVILDRYEQKKPFYLYTGRGPSKGHDEKFLFKTGVSLEETYKYSFSTVREISALGFKPNKTFIFSDLDYMGGNFYRNIIKISKSITGNTAKAVFGFTESDCIGKVFYPSIQIAPCFSSSFPDIFGNLKGIPCLIPCGIDQDPYFRLTRDISVKLGHPKPALLHSKFLPSLQGSKSKMSTSVDNTAIFTDDTPAMVKNKIRRHAFSGGGSTLELHRLHGGDPEVDIPYQYMNFFVDDDELMKKYYDGYKSGDITSGQMKDYCIDVIQKFLADFQEKEKAVTDQDVLDFMNPKYPRKFDLLKF
ncbi:Tryptophan-tRNA ligase, cytoplasmic [Smittium culicis]|uniref:tryptophan--tRNA ligase n=1 Tax=Smittium culicis TaxID=133412 RepID=A0A1R1XZM0_9FUNG|nr:Tryptophan-tRNA ligase, cytoplasmic [Smittium culicis]OMJ20141.1 Tryptophan-tRNA ligase, cytoplasmic [Smittium culicis]